MAFISCRPVLGVFLYLFLILGFALNDMDIRVTDILSLWNFHRGGGCMAEISCKLPLPCFFRLVPLPLAEGSAEAEKCSSTTWNLPNGSPSANFGA